jgi:hypothetical protein
MAMLPELVPSLVASLCPPEILGTAALTTAAMNGMPLDGLLGLIDADVADPVARMFDMATVCFLASRRADALALQAQVLRAFPVLRVRSAMSGDAPLRVMALLAPGDLMINTPLDFITAHLDVRLDLLFLVPGQALPESVPDHDVLFVAISEADPALLGRLGGLLAAWPRPVVNRPDALPLLGRDRLALLLADTPGLCSPATVAIGRSELPGRQDIAYPVLLRPLGSHAGHGLEKIDGPDALAAYLATSDVDRFYLSAFVDYRGGDGLYRKYRVAFMEGRAELCHMAASSDWMVHYLNAGMMEHAERRALEAAEMAGFEAGFARRHHWAFQALLDRLPFDYFSVDCSELPDGRLLVFEADTGAIIHLMEDPGMFPYKHAQMHRVFDAFDAMLRRRAVPPPQALAA